MNIFEVFFWRFTQYFTPISLYLYVKDNFLWAKRKKVPSSTIDYSQVSSRFIYLESS